MTIQDLANQFVRMTAEEALEFSFLGAIAERIPFQTKLSGSEVTEDLNDIYTATKNLSENDRKALIDLLDANLYSMGGRPCGKK